MSDSGIQVKLTPCHPGEFLRREALEEFGLSLGAAAEILGLPEAVLADLVHAKTRLTPETALRIEKAFALKMELLLRLQAWYDAVQMRARWDEVEVQPYPPAWAAQAAQPAKMKGE